ncbi:uncharacterized protein LAESUDRAFT_688338 [Laetiporus sulphureus 93-53]|uniref:Ribonucleases P/MRP subunit Pop8-like domain-containing protein n=1 Tax=Laetiporus sulphureus 93-53 TaxID=1314785 RepID=A0A165B5D2_9APHY|nr:uncharacterized protein LAESUDRAFT_688338 [Laetiporus sulphureus 93-53]KZT00276.1 hypothetical protein LAESUDRAFT_688338 [Laetiporus sulphureus 93-53]
MPTWTVTSPLSYHYIKFSVSPPCTDALLLRKSLQDALDQSFGLVSANTYVDVLWVSEEGSETVVRIAHREAAKLMAATTVYQGPRKLSVLKESPFLPTLSSVQITL